MKIYFIRHGETNENAAGIVQGWLDTELNQTGKRQAKEAAEHFDKPIEAIYCSDLKRAKQTAEEFREKYPELPYEEDERLRERNFGDAAGTHRDQHDWEQFWAHENEVTIPHAESLKDFTQRVAAFLEDVTKLPYSSILVVCHGGVLNRVQAIMNPGHEHIAYKNATVLEVEM